MKKEDQLPMPDETHQWLSERPNQSESPLPHRLGSCPDGNQSLSKRPSKQPLELDSTPTFFGDTLLGPLEIESAEAQETKSDVEEAQINVRRIIEARRAKETDTETLSIPTDQGTDLTTTLKNVANTYEYLRNLGFSNEALGPLANTFEYLTDLSNRETTGLLENTHLVKDASTKPLAMDTIQGIEEEHQ